MFQRILYMKNYQILAVALLALSSCGVNSGKTKTAEQQADSTTLPGDSVSAKKLLVADMQIRDTIRSGDSVLLTFTVRNNTGDSLRFCKWHTPFEPLMSKYLDITDEKGAGVDYKGPMAKRMMPPPASSYVKVNANDSLSIKVDLLKAYSIDKPAKYTITYNSQEISGLVVKKSISFIYLK